MKFPIITRVLLFWVIGIAATAVLGGLASIKPSVFGLFTLPFWILPALLGLGAHDNIFPLGLLGASLFLWSRFFRCLSPTSRTDYRCIQNRPTRSEASCV